MTVVVPQPFNEIEELSENDKYNELVAAFAWALGVMFNGSSSLDEELLEHFAETPERMARSWLEMFNRPEPKLTFFNARGRNELLLEANIPFSSFCAHHMLPFVGHVTIGYIPAGKIIGLSKFSRVVDYLASRPQTQERLTGDIANYLYDSELAPQALGVLVRAEHMCVHLRGVEKHGVETVTSALRGSFKDDPAQREEFLSLAKLKV